MQRLRAGTIIYAAALVVLSASVARGAGFAISLKLSDGKQRESVKNAPNPAGPLDHRLTLQGSAPSQFTAAWAVKRSAHSTAADVLVHFYVVRLEKPGEVPPPLEPKRVAVESALTMDLPPGESARANVPFRVDAPGVYLVRIEISVDAQPPSPDDHAEMELVVK